MSVNEEKEGDFYVVEPVELTSESEPEEVVDIEELDEIR